jgi:hypothetical protein
LLSRNALNVTDLCAEHPNSSSEHNDEDNYFIADDACTLTKKNLTMCSQTSFLWTEGAGNHFRKPFTGNNRAIKYRRLAQANARLEVATQCQSIKDFFKPVVGPIGTETVDNIQPTISKLQLGLNSKMVRIPSCQ